MATFKFNGTIYVRNAETAQQAINALQTALAAYGEMNPGGASIVIHHEKPKEVKEWEVTLFIMGLPYHESRTRQEIIEAVSEKEAERIAHEWFFPDGWGVYETKLHLATEDGKPDVEQLDE